MDFIQGLAFSIDSLINIFGDPIFFVFFSAIIIFAALQRLGVPIVLSFTVSVIYVITLSLIYHIIINTTLAIITLLLGTFIGIVLLSLTRR